MDAQKHVLLVTNSTTDAEITLIKEALHQSASQGFKIKLSLVHVIPSMPVYYFNIPSMVKLTQEYYQNADKTLATISNTLNVEKQDRWLITGKAKTEILCLAKKLNIDFVLASSVHVAELNKSFSFRKALRKRIIKPIASLG